MGVCGDDWLAFGAILKWPLEELQFLVLFVGFIFQLSGFHLDHTTLDTSNLVVHQSVSRSG